MNYYLKIQGDNKMKVFISWSGSKSQEVAKILKQWIPCVIQSVEPYFSSADIDKGARWSTDIAKELQDASFGILCVTKENLSSSWLNFEAGALSKSIDQSKVCPFLVDLKPSDIQNSPILQFQMTSATKDEVLKLFESINANLGEKQLNETVLSTTFDTFWPKIDEALQNVTKKDITKSVSSLEEKNLQPLEEILELVRYQHKLLKNPVDLLPPDYLLDIFRKGDRYLRRKSLPRDYYMEIIECTNYLNKILCECANDCMALDNESRDIPNCAMSIQKAKDLSERLMMMVKRWDLDERF